MTAKKYEVPLKAITRLIETGCAVDVSYNDGFERPLSSTVVFHSIGTHGVNGVVLRNDATGEMYAVRGRCNALYRIIR